MRLPIIFFGKKDDNNLIKRKGDIALKAIMIEGNSSSKLRPVTSVIQKPLIELLGKTLFEYNAELLKKHGVEEILVFGQKWPLYKMKENMPGIVLSRAGENLRDFVDRYKTELSSVIPIVRSDVLTDFDLSSILHTHSSSGARVTSLCYKKQTPYDGGDNGTEDGNPQIFTGMAIVNKEILELLPQDDREGQVLSLIRAVEANRLKIEQAMLNGYFNEISTVEELLKGTEDIFNGTVDVKRCGTERNGVWIEDGAIVSSSASVERPAYIGKGATVGQGASIGAYSAIGEYSRICEGAVIKRSLIMSNVKVGRGAKISRGIICSNTLIGENARVYEKSVVARDCFIGRGASVSPGVRVWPEKWVRPGASVNTNIIWGSGKSGTVFSCHGICGTINAELFMSDISLAGQVFAAAAGLFPTIAVAHEPNPSAEMLALAFLSGAMAAGAKVMYGGRCFYPEIAEYSAHCEAMAYAMAMKDGTFNIAMNIGGELSVRDVEKMNEMFDTKLLRRPDEKNISHVENADMRNAYLESLSGKYMEGAPIYVVNDRRWPFMKEALLRAGADAVSSEPDSCLFSMAPNRTLTAGSFSSGEAKAEGEYAELLCYSVLMDAFRPEVIYIPPTAGKAVWQLASEKNISLAVDESIDYDARYKRYFMDLPYFAALLRKTLLEKRTSFADYMKGLPEIRSASRTIKCEWQDIAEMLNGSGENTEKDRARFSSEVGEGWIYADGYRPIVHIRAEGADMETAEAICESCYEAVKRYLQKRHQFRISPLVP